MQYVQSTGGITFSNTFDETWTKSLFWRLFDDLNAARPTKTDEGGDGLPPPAFDITHRRCC